MALTLTNLGTATATSTPAQTFNRTLVPADNSVVYYCVHARHSSLPGTPTASDTSGATWTNVANRGSGVIRTVIFRAKFSGTSPGSLTVTVDWGASVNTCAQGAIEALGANLTTPEVGSAVTGTGTSTGPNVGTLSALAAGGNGRILVVGHARGTADQTPEAGWTERFDVAAGGGAMGMCAAVLVGEDTTPTYTLGSSVAWNALAIEVAEAVAAAPDPFVTVQFR